MTSSHSTEVYVEHRVCGESNTRGRWDGQWKREDPHRGTLYDLCKRNERVWIERRRVTVEFIGRDDVQT